MLKNLIYSFLFILVPVSVLAQDMISRTEIDSLYREDQFYVGVTYNILVNTPENVNNEGFSGGFHLGFLR
ncbi:MAG: PorT family protein, partial [Rickettsiaceae bacterium]|nr:PorT family protein [Rickettsiaceae bacterium]